MSRRLVLFDIDGTLVSAGRISARVFAEALLEAFGTMGDAEEYDYSGKTDPQIVRELMRGAGFTDEEIEQRRPRALEDYHERLAEADPAALLPDFSDTEAAVAAILGDDSS